MPLGWKAGLECGDASELYTLSSGWSVVNSNARTGSYSLKEDLSALSSWQTNSLFWHPSDLGRLSVRFGCRLQVVGSYVSGEQPSCNVLIHGAVGTSFQAGFVYSGSELGFNAPWCDDDSNYTNTYGEGAIAANTYHVVEMFACYATNTVGVKLDGAVKFKGVVGPNKIRQQAFRGVQLVGQRSDASHYLIVSWDDFEVYDSDMFPSDRGFNAPALFKASGLRTTDQRWP